MFKVVVILFFFKYINLMYIMLCIMYCIELIRNDFVQQIPMQIA